MLSDSDLRQYFSALWPLYTNLPMPSIEDLPVTINTKVLTAGFKKDGFLHHFDWTEELHKIQCPTLLVVGKDDWINPPSLAIKMSKHIQYGELHILDGRHIIWEDQPEQY